jgi:hypothetical protein
MTSNDTGKALNGHCSRCHKVWTLSEPSGVCKWCGKSATCQTSSVKQRRIKTRRTQQRPERPDGIIDGYDQLEGDWQTYYKVALPFAKTVPAQDSADLLDTIIMVLADISRNTELSEGGMYRVASRTRADYWREHYKHTNGLDCGHCSNQQRRKCKKDNLYSRCPKAIKIESLHKPIIDSEGNLTELGELIADDTALDIPQWLEISEQLLHAPDRMMAIAGKIQDGETLTHAERTYMYKARKRLQKSLL